MSNEKPDTEGEHHVIMEAETGVMYEQAKECQGLLATSEAKRKAWNIFSPRAFRERAAQLTP